MLYEKPISDAEQLGSMLTMLDGSPDRQEQVCAWIDARFGRTEAVMVMDMCGFSRTTREHGIVEFLRRMYEVQQIIMPIIRDEAGMVMNTLADSLACLFPTVQAAVTASTRMIMELDVINEAFPDKPDHYLSIGIGYGRVLVIDGRDVFGDEMNHAGKLGEDEAGQREILLTPKAMVELGSSTSLALRTVSIGGADVECGCIDLGAPANS